VLDERNLTLGEAQLVLTALAGSGTGDRRVSAIALVAVFAARNRPGLERPFRRLLATV
jgi:hypothetical protein